MSKAVIVVLALSAAWLGSVLAIGYREMSSSRDIHVLLASDQFYQCRMAQRTDCYDQRDATDSDFEASLSSDWTRVVAWAAIPPAIISSLTWFFFGRKRKGAGGSTQDAGPGQS